MSSLYYDFLYPETKEILFGHFPKNYVNVLSRVLTLTNYIASEIKSKLKQDLIMLLGFANGQYGVATTHNVRLTTNSGYVTLTTNEGDVYGVNRLSFKNQHLSPSYLTFNSDDKHPLEYKDIITTIKNDKYIRTSHFPTKFYYCSRKNVIASSYVKKRAKHLFYFFDDARAVVRENNQTIRFRENIKTEHHQEFIKAILESSIKVNPDIVRKLSLHSLIRYLSNPLWRDLNVPVNKDFVSHLHVPYHRLSYYYKKYGTKKLREVYFGTSVKVIQNVLSTDESLIPFYKYLSETIDVNVLDINHQVRFLRSLSSHSLSRYSYQRLNRSFAQGIKYLLDVGYSFRRIINSFEASERSRDLVNYVTDIPFMVNRVNLHDADVHITSDNISTIHDKLAEADRRKRDSAYYGRNIELTEEEVKYEFKDDSYYFKPANITDDLANLGNKLSICVRSYADRAIAKHCTIVGVYDVHTNDPICCIEVTNGSIVQAKLLRNTYASSDKKLNQLILDWALEHKLKIRTRDLNENSTSD